MDLQIEESVMLLSRTPSALQVMLRGLPESWMRATEGPETWSPFDVVGHLIHCERTDWLPRIVIVVGKGESRMFEPFDRFAQFTSSRGKDMEQLLEEFATLRAGNITRLKALALTSAHYELRGRHPSLGTVSLRNLLASWVVHDLTHISQIVRVMAKQYAEHVGPFEIGLSILGERRAHLEKSA